MAADAEHILAEVGLQAAPDLVKRVGDYLDGTRRGRRRGLIAGFALNVAASAFFPFQPGRLKPDIPLMLVGYVLGILITELRAPVATRPRRRAADLTIRRSANLVPRWARLAMWAAALPVLSALALLHLAAAWIHSVKGVNLAQTASYTCFGSPVTWPSALTLAVAVALAITGLLIAESGLAALARRPRPADDEAEARLDDVLRGMSARAICGGATALGLTLTAMVCDAISELSSSNVCVPGAAAPVPQYPWVHAYLHPWAGLAGLPFFIAAVVTIAICRRRQDPRLLVRQEAARAAA